MTRQLWLADKLRAYGLTVIEVPGWQDRGRPGLFDPAGVIVHHTAGPKGKPAPSLNVCVEGRTGLPGPLCHVLLARNCTCYVIAAGRANHAGEGRWAGITDGNRAFLGLEAENDGVGEPWAPDMLDAFHRASAALLHGLDRLHGPLIAHREWAPTRKIDPKGIDMDAFRRAVEAAERGHIMPPPARTDYARQIQEALISNGATTLVPDDKLGPATVAATKAVLTFLNAEVKRLGREIDGLRVPAGALADALARREAAEAEAAQLRQQLQQGGRLPQLLADLDMASTDIGRAWDDLNEAIAKARA